jgi:hypothetical protein
MKLNIIVLVIVVTSSFGFAQIPTLPGKIFKTPEKIKIVGSPYNEKMFSQAKVGSIEQKPFMRYNIFEDQFEFISTKNDTLILDKTEDFGEIVFTNTNKKFKLTTYTNLKNKLLYGYLIDLYSKNKTHLFKKDNISFTEEKIAKTTLERDMPAKYAANSPFYYIEYSDKMPTEFPENKKGLLKLFPEKKVAIDTFFKENKINFSDENDLKKVVDLIAGF